MKLTSTRPHIFTFFVFLPNIAQQTREQALVNCVITGIRFIFSCAHFSQHLV